MSKISKIYNSTQILYRAGSRKGKRRDQIESRKSGSIFNGKGMGKMRVANKKINQHFDDIKKLSNEERLKRIRENNKPIK